MTSRIRLSYIFAGALGVALAIGLIAILSVQIALGDEDDDGSLDEGSELVGEASIPVDEAVSIAEAEASGTVDDVELERRGDQLVYAIEVGESDVYIDANDGTVLAVDSDDDDAFDDDDDELDDDGEETRDFGEPAITRDEALDIAREEVQGDVSEVELDVEAGQLVYSIEIGNQEVEVDAMDGTVLSVESDD